jgi:tetratricopeptide (TPR) repeat protein
MKMMEYSMRLGISFRDNHPYLKSSLLQNLPNLLTNLNKVQSFSGLLSIYKDKEDDFYRGIYFLICGGLVVFADKVSQMSDDERFGRLLKMSARMKQMDLIEIFEFMGGKPGSTEAQVQAIHSDFTRRFLGNHNGISGIPGFSDLYNDVKKKSDMVLQLFLNPKALKQYEQKKLEKKATDQIRAETVIQETKKLLSMNQYQKAIELLQTLPQHLVLENRNLYLAWAKIGFMDSSKTKVKDMQEVETILMQTTAEEKVSAIGNFVKGLIAKQRGEFAIAKKYFETAMALDRNFIEARRELSGIVKSASEAKPPDLLKGDLKDVVSYLFKGQKKK